MKNNLVFTASILGLWVLAACNSASGPVAPTLVPASTLQATAENKTLPTTMPASQVAIYADLQVLMNEAEITASYPTEYGSNREPPADKRFLWIHLLLKNIGSKEQDLPAPEHFSAIFGTAEFKPAYGHRQDHADYLALNTSLVEGQQVDAWLRFDIPAEAELQNLIFAFLPESSQVSLGFSSSDYSWADHPIFLWNCAP